MPSRADLVSTDLGRAVAALRAGGVVAVPTETVYGLAADARSPTAVARIYAIKGRPSDHPLIVHVNGADDVDGWALEISDEFDALAATCWPGPLTMLVSRGPRVIDAITGGRPTVALRAPAHPLTQRLIRDFGGAIAAPSANRFGRVSPTTADHVFDDIGDRLEPGVDLILDGGPCRIGIESTIVDLTVQPPQVLRDGAITRSDITRLLGTGAGETTGASRASGMLASHYAPTCRVELVESADEARSVSETRRSEGQRCEVLDRTDDLVVAARRLYDDLRGADRAGVETLIVVLPPPTGLGVALRDRLTKAAAAGPPNHSTPTS